MLISTSNSDRRLSASVLAVRTSLLEETCCGKSNMFLWTEGCEEGEGSGPNRETTQLELVSQLDFLHFNFSLNRLII